MSSDELRETQSLPWSVSTPQPDPAPPCTRLVPLVEMRLKMLHVGHRRVETLASK